MAKNITTDSTIKFFVTVIGIAVIALILRELAHIFIPFVIAYLLYFLFSPMNSFLEKEKFPMGLIVLADILIIALITWGISSFIIGSFLRFGEQVPLYADKLNTIISAASVSLGINDPFFRNFSIQKLIAGIDYQLLAGGIFSSTFSILGNILFILFFFIFVASGHNTIYEAIKNRYVIKKVKPELKKIKKKYQSTETAVDTDLDQWINDKVNIERQSKEEKLEKTFRAITGQIQRYIIMKIAVNLSAAIIITVVLALFGIDFPIIWGLFAFLFNFIPTIGSAIALILPTLMALVQYESIGYAVLIAAILGGIQTVFFSLIETSLIGKRLNLNPLLILLSVLVWGYIWGVVGMLLSVPLTAIIKIVISNSSSKNLKFISELMGKD
jgi:predicted PurR-regulated permease PerM